MKIILAVLIFSLIILFHELGHFLLAKKNGITVTEFSLGMGPRLFSVEKGGTRYSLKVFPLGGSCAMLGEDTEEEELPGSFNSASVFGRIAVVAAGPIFNFILAFVLATVIVGVVGYNPALVLSVEEESPAGKAGLREGDTITEFNGCTIDLGKDLYVYIYMNGLNEEPVTLKYRRDGKEYEISYVPDADRRYLLGFNRTDANSLQVESLIPGMPLEQAGVQKGDVLTGINGVELSDGEAYERYIQEHPLDGTPVEIVYRRDGLEYEAVIIPEEYRTPKMGFSYNIGNVKTKGLPVLKYGALEVKYMIRTTIISLKELFIGNLAVSDLSGPVGVVDAIGDAYEQSKEEGTLIVWMNMLNMAVMLSANLGIMNLLPFPALDGGRLVFLLIEAVRRKPANRKIEGMVHFAGFMLLMALMVFVMYQDVRKLL